MRTLPENAKSRSFKCSNGSQMVYPRKFGHRLPR
jgi:hypothetical protein